MRYASKPGSRCFFFEEERSFINIETQPNYAIAEMCIPYGRYTIISDVYIPLWRDRKTELQTDLAMEDKKSEIYTEIWTLKLKQIFVQSERCCFKILSCLW